MRFLLNSKTKLKLTKLVFTLVLIFFSLSSLAPTSLAQTQPQNQPSSVEFVQTVPPDQQTVPVPGGFETGRVQQLDAIFGGLGGIVGAIKDIPKNIFNFIKDNIGTFLKKFIIQALKIVASVLGFVIEKYEDACKGTFGAFGDFLSDGSGASNEQIIADSTNFNALVALDYGVNGVYNAASEGSSPTYFVQDIKSSVLGIEDAHAQGVGIEDLNTGIRKIWQRMRDLAIIFMVIALVVIGFMVMLRRRLDPKTVVTATSALPKFAIALVLIIFSFAISAFFIDMIHVSVALVRSFFDGVLATFSSELGGEFVWFPIFTAFSLGTAFNWAAVICSPIGFLSPGGAFALLFLIFIIEIFIRLVLVIVGIYLFWILLKNYAYMVLFTIFSPLMFLLGAIPGFESVTINWFKRMAINTVAFPLILFLIYLALSLISQTNPVSQLEGAVSAPPPLQGNILNIPYFIGLGMIFFATKVPTFLEKMFKLDSFDVKGGLGAGVLAAPIAVPAAGLKAAGNFGKTLSGLRSLSNEGSAMTRGASNALFRAGHQRGATYFESPTGNFVTPTAEPKQGFMASAARGVGRLIPGNLRDRDANASQPIVKTQRDRDAAIIHEMDNARKEGRAPQPGRVPREFGQVNQADFDRMREQERTFNIARRDDAPEADERDREERDVVDDPDRPRI